MTAPSPYATAVAVRAWWAPLFDNATTYPSAMLEGLVERFEGVAERARGVAYVRREREIATTATLPYCVLIPDAPVDVEVTAVSVNGTALTAGELADLYPVGVDRLLSNGPWGIGDRLVIAYTVGFEEPTASILHGGMEFVRFHALARVNAQPRNVISYTDDSGYTFRESTADWKAGRYTGIRVVDDAINEEHDYRLPGIA